MKVVLTMLCVGAVIFLLRVLAAFVREAMHAPPVPVKLYLAKFYPSKASPLRKISYRQRGELVIINAQSRISKLPSGTGQRIALVILIATALVYPMHGQQWMKF
jgi:hypothetical protein